jgi:hypothetical protein
VSEQNITKARGGNNAVYEMEAGAPKVVRGAKPRNAVIDESPEHSNEE